MRCLYLILTKAKSPQIFSTSASLVWMSDLIVDIVALFSMLSLLLRIELAASTSSWLGCSIELHESSICVEIQVMWLYFPQLNPRQCTKKGWRLLRHSSILSKLRTQWERGRTKLRPVRRVVSILFIWSDLHMFLNSSETNSDPRSVSRIFGHSCLEIILVTNALATVVARISLIGIISR